VVYAKLPSESIFGLSLAVLNLFGVPKSVQVTGTSIDVDRLIFITNSKTGDVQTPINFMTASGSLSSGSEHGIIEQLYGVQAVSAVKIIHLANLQGLKIYRITAPNLAAVLPILQVANDVKTDIQNAIYAGKEVLIPESELQYYQWTGVGYVISDPSTGAGSYLISGGTAGGSGAQGESLSNITRRINFTSCLYDNLENIIRYLLILGLSTWLFFYGTGIFVELGVVFGIIAVIYLITIIYQCIIQSFGADERQKRDYLISELVIGSTT